MGTTKKSVLMKCCVIGVMSALVFAASQISIKLPMLAMAGGTPRIHLGNIMCLLSGLLFGGLASGMSSGLGSALYDLFDPVYITSAPTTFINKFMMGFVCGKIAHGRNRGGMSRKWNIVAAIAGQFTYVVLYSLKNFLEIILLGGNDAFQTALVATAQKGVISLINAVIAVVVAVPLAFAVRKALNHSSLYQSMFPSADTAKS